MAHIERLEVFVEEPSMEAALRSMLPRWLGEIDFEIYTYQGKDDLLSKLPSRLRAYANYLPANWRILVLLDRDNSDCKKLKQQLETCAKAAGLSTKSTSNVNEYQVINRIVVEELESWYFGDWQSVKRVFPKMDGAISSKSAFRTPDAITGGTWEAFERIAQKAGYFKGGLRKIEAARRLGPVLDPTLNTSRSFQAFYSAIRELTSKT